MKDLKCIENINGVLLNYYFWKNSWIFVFFPPNFPKVLIFLFGWWPINLMLKRWNEIDGSIDWKGSKHVISCVVGNFYLYSRWMNLLYTSVNLVITENIVNTKEEDNSNKIVCFFPSESDFRWKTKCRNRDAV